MRTSESQSPRILVVDDDAVVRRMASETLGRAGYAVVQACSNTEALRVAADERPAELLIVGASAETARVRETLSRLAPTRAAGVLIVGDAGVGKTWLAGALHAGSHRHHAPCLLLDCGRAFAPAVALFGADGNGGLL